MSGESSEPYTPSPEEELFAKQAFTPKDEPAPKQRRERSNISYLPDVHRLLPQSPDAEQGILGSLLISSREVVGECIEKGLEAKCFHIPAHATIYATILELSAANKATDFITLTEVLRNKGQLDQVGGAGFVTGLFTFVPTAANRGYYIDIVLEKFTLREIIRICTESAARSYDEQSEVDLLVSELHEKVTSLALKKGPSGKAINQLALEAIERFQERREGIVSLVQTGIPRLDAESPMRPGDFVVIAGRRKSGKSALAADIIRNVCITNDHPCGVFSIEMPDWQWVERLIANTGRISLTSIGSGRFTPEEEQKVNPTVTTIAGSKLHLFDGIHDLAGIQAKARQLKATIPELPLIVVDYCQLVTVPERKGGNREQEVAKVSRTLKMLAGELGIVVIGLSQLNNDGETRESRALENDCTALWQVLEDLDKFGKPVKGSQNKRTIYCPFQRNGAPDIRIRMEFIGKLSAFNHDTDFPEYEEEEQENRPHKKQGKFRY